MQYYINIFFAFYLCFFTLTLSIVKFDFPVLVALDIYFRCYFSNTFDQQTQLRY